MRFKRMTSCSMGQLVFCWKLGIGIQQVLLMLDSRIQPDRMGIESIKMLD